MIDNLIYDLIKKIGLIWSYILKDMNFLIFRDFTHVNVFSEIKHSFQSLRYLINHLLLIYRSNFLNLCHVALYFCFNMRR